MPKIRGVKPDYWTDDAIVELTLPARLLFVGLWNYACDNGHLQDKSRQIKMRILPADDVNVAELLRELESHDRIQRHEGWITIPNFTKHQRPDKRYFQTCDAPDCERPHADAPPGTRGGHHETTTSARGGLDVVSMGPHVDGDGDGEGEVMVKDADKSAKRATPIAKDWSPSEAHHQLATTLGVDILHEGDKFRDWCIANGRKYKDWEAGFRNWIRNARPTGNVRPLRPATDDQGRTILPPLPPSSPWGPA